MVYGLRPSAIERIQAVFARHPEVEKAVLYGSRAKGTHNAGSDIDLTLYGQGLTLPQLNVIALELDDLLLPYTIDLSIFTRLTSPDLQEHIMRVGKVFYERKNQ